MEVELAENERQYWSGKVSWCNVDRVDNFGRWSLTLYPDTKAYNEIMKLKQEGLQNVIKKDDDGYYLNISRPIEVRMKTGKALALAPPVVIDSEGLNLAKKVGKGSDVTVKVEIRRYKTPRNTEGVAVRLESVRVDNLVTFEPERDFPPAIAKAVAGLDTAPKSVHPF
jgi:hypothetical protein